MNAKDPASARIFVHKRSSYIDGVITPRETAQNKSLSWCARGFLTYCLSLPADWELRETHLIGESPSGRDRLRSIVRELEAAGYLRRSYRRNARGVIRGTNWEVFDLPQTPKPLTENPATVDPLTACPSPENPSMDEIQSETELCPSTAFPSVVAPLTAYPSPENPSTYKEEHLYKETALEPLTPQVGNEDRATRMNGTNPRATGENPRAKADKAPADPYSRKVLPDNAIPNDLLDLQELLPEWWGVKKGVRSAKVFMRVCNKVRPWAQEQRCSALESAIAGGWADIYPPKTLSAPSGRPRNPDGTPMTSAQIAASHINDHEARVAAFLLEHPDADANDLPTAWETLRTLRK